MAKHGGSYSKGGYRGGGFTNHRTGKYVSPARAHQHTGQSLAGWTKVQSKTTGNFYMAEKNK